MFFYISMKSQSVFQTAKFAENGREYTPPPKKGGGIATRTQSRRWYTSREISSCRSFTSRGDVAIKIDSERQKRVLSGGGGESALLPFAPARGTSDFASYIISRAENGYSFSHSATLDRAPLAISVLRRERREK